MDQRLEVDSVVINLRHRPLVNWMHGLEGTLEVHMIGDCLEPRKAIDAMVDGARIGRLI